MFSNDTLSQYFDRMVGRLYKILPLKETGEDTIHDYLESLMVEMTGADILAGLSDQPYYVSIVSIVAYLNRRIDRCDTRKVKREVFKAINLCKKLQHYYQDGVYDDKP